MSAEVPKYTRLHGVWGGALKTKKPNARAEFYFANVC